MSWTIERRGRIAVVTMTTNPVNAQNRAFFGDLHEAFDRLERDHAESPVVLTGTGGRFSAGLDLGEHFPLFAGDPEAVASWFRDYRATNMRLFTYRRPTVAAVNGHAFAGGLITAAVCDHRIAVIDNAARFGLNEVPIGIPMPAVSACSRMPGATRSRPERACSERSSLQTKPGRWECSTNSCRPRSWWTARLLSPGKRPRTASSSTRSRNVHARPKPCATSPNSLTRSTTICQPA
jgi:hypothetical protein